MRELANAGTLVSVQSVCGVCRCVEYLFQRLAERSSAYEVALVCSFLEIYCDEIRDLGKAYSVNVGVRSSCVIAAQ